MYDDFKLFHLVPLEMTVWIADLNFIKIGTEKNPTIHMYVTTNVGKTPRQSPQWNAVETHKD